MPASSGSSSSSGSRSPSPPSPPPPPLAPADQRTAASQDELAREIANDKAVLLIWQTWLHPLKTEFGDRWVEQRWVDALAGFHRETDAAALETEGFFKRNNTTLATLREKYISGPPDYVKPGYKSPHLGERFDLSQSLPALRGLGWRPTRPALSTSSSSSSSSSSSPLPAPAPSDGTETPGAGQNGDVSSGAVEYHPSSSRRNAWEGAKGKVVLVEFWASWCDGCIVAFPALALLQRTYAPLLQIVSINNPHVFAPNPRAPRVTPAQADEARQIEWAFLSDTFSEAWARRAAEDGAAGAVGQDGLVDPLSFTIWEDPEGKVTEDVFKRIAVPFIPNAFIFVDGRLFWQGEPDVQDPAIGFTKAVEEAVEIVGGVREAPAWFLEQKDDAGDERRG